MGTKADNFLYLPKGQRHLAGILVRSRRTKSSMGFLVLFFGGLALAQPEPPSHGLLQPEPLQTLGQLWVPSVSAGYQRMDPMEYEPREGDLLFFTDEKWIRRVAFWFAGTGRPYHVALVIKGRDGSLCTLEARPHSESWVFLLDLQKRMTTYHGSIWVRRLRNPLEPDASKKLTQFALTQQGKPFAMFRLAFEGTPLNVRAGLGQFLWASPRTEKNSWFCSELTTAALIECGMFQGRGIKPNCVYPRDLFYDRTFLVGDLYEAPILWGPTLEEGPPPPRLVGLPKPEPLKTLGPTRRVAPTFGAFAKELPPLLDGYQYTGKEEDKQKELGHDPEIYPPKRPSPMAFPGWLGGTGSRSR